MTTESVGDREDDKLSKIHHCLEMLRTGDVAIVIKPPLNYPVTIELNRRSFTVLVIIIYF